MSPKFFRKIFHLQYTIRQSNGTERAGLEWELKLEPELEELPEIIEITLDSGLPSVLCC